MKYKGLVIPLREYIGTLRDETGSELMFRRFLLALRRQLISNSSDPTYRYSYNCWSMISISENDRNDAKISPYPVRKI